MFGRRKARALCEENKQGGRSRVRVVCFMCARTMEPELALISKVAAKQEKLSAEEKSAKEEAQGDFKRY